MASIENLEPLYIDKKFQEKETEILKKKVFRHNKLGMRIYTTEDNESYISLTTFLGAVMPKQKYLEKWRNDLIDEFKSAEKVDEYVEMTADYGTYLHIAVSEFIRTGVIDWNMFENDAASYLLPLGFKGNVLELAIKELKNDTASILQFLYDYDCRVIAVELPVFSKKYGIATCIDLIVDKTVNPVKNREDIEIMSRHKAIINLKSGKKGFFETHVLQLAGEEMLFHETYKNMLVSNVFNLAPKDWTSQPTYKIQDQTDKMLEAKAIFRNFVETARLKKMFDFGGRKVNVLQGVTKLGDNPSDYIVQMPVFDYVLASQSIAEEVI